MKRAEVSLEAGRARVVYEDTKQTPGKLAAAIDMLGFKAAVVGVADASGEGPAAPRR